MAGATFFESIKAYVGFTDDSTAALGAFRPTVAPHFPAIVDDFYDAIERHAGARAAITGGEAQIQRLKQTLIRWLDGLFLGPHNEAYFEMRARIGRVHVRIDLPQAFMLTAMNRIRVRLLSIARGTLGGDLHRLAPTAEAINQILDLELAIMLETYREDLIGKNRAAERLATIGQLAAGIGHELRNPLGVMESSLFLVKQQLGAAGFSDPGVTRHLDKIGVEVKRSNKTITDLLELARHRPPRRQRTDLAAVVRAAAETAALPPEVSVSLDIAADATADADPDQLATVLSNLFRNASQAMSGRGRIEVEARRQGGGVSIRIRDEGPGVPPDIRHRIFEALFTTKAKGSGLGLALCRRILEAHGGTITLEPSERGSSFLVWIPDQASQGEKTA